MVFSDFARFACLKEAEITWVLLREFWGGSAQVENPIKTDEFQQFPCLETNNVIAFWCGLDKPGTKKPDLAVLLLLVL